MSKAFDTLNHEILLRKLVYYGVKGLANKLLQSYLSERLEYVEFERHISDKLPTTTGVPQVSILGPLLFLIYINDLPSVGNFFKMIMYADDTTLYCNINKTTTEGIINTELAHVNVWLKANKLSLNVAKTKFMVFHTSNNIVNYPKLKINDHVVERVQIFNFLGLLVHYNMTWSKHIEKDHWHFEQIEINVSAMYFTYLKQYSYNAPLALFIVDVGFKHQIKTSTTFITEESFTYNNK